MTSLEMRNNPLFMRNAYNNSGKYELPIIKKQLIENLSYYGLLACSDTKRRENKINKEKGVYFFVDDYRFSGIYYRPGITLKKYSQYKFLLTPDYSLYVDMPMWLQIQNVAKNRWVGAYWQSHGLNVIPTISWSTPSSYDFCFDSIETGSVVAIGMIGSKQSRFNFMHGYDAMLERIAPSAILCFGTPYKEMKGNLITYDYMDSRKKVR